MRLRLAELVAAWSLATDLGLGLPQEHVLRQCRIALGLAERLGLDEVERAAVYYVAMLAWVGCTADSHELAVQFGDDLALRADAHRVDLAGWPMVGSVASGRRRTSTAAAGGDGRGAGGDRRARGCGGDDRALPGGGADRAAAGTRGPEVQEPLLHVFSAGTGRGSRAGRAARRCRLRSGSFTSQRSPRSITAVAASRPRSRLDAIAPEGSSIRVWWGRSPTAPASCWAGWPRSRAGTR